MSEARGAMGLGHRPQGSRSETPLPAHLEESGVIELPAGETLPSKLKALWPVLLGPFKKS